MTTALPATMKALVLAERDQPPSIQIVPTPAVIPGSAVVRVLTIGTISYTREVIGKTRNYPIPTPIIPGYSAIGRVAAVPADATKLQPGDLVFVDDVARARDEPADNFLAGVHHGYTPGSQKLMSDAIRDWTSAEFCRAPLENLIRLDEQRLLGSPSEGGLGYTLEDLGYIGILLVPYGGLKDIQLQPGETVIVAPATGQFGGGAVLAALGMGARVIAMGRNKETLARIKATVPDPSRVETVPITGDMEGDCAELKKFGEIDAFFDIGPNAALKSTHLRSAIWSLRHGARISLMGGYKEDVPIPHTWIMHRNMRIFGKWMYERSDVIDLVKLIERGNLKLGKAGGIEVVGSYPLEQFKEAWDLAADNSAMGQIVGLNPSQKS